MSPSAILLVLSLQLLLFRAAEGTGAAPAERCDATVAILQRIADLVDFFAADPGRVNADGYFGVRMSRDILGTAGGLRAALTRLDAACSGPLLPERRTRRLVRILARQDLLLGHLATRLAKRAGYNADTLARICKPLADRLRGLLDGRVSLPTDDVIGGGSDGDASAEVPAAAGDPAGLVDVDYDEAKGDACLLGALRPGCTSQKKPSCSYFDRPLDQSSGYYLTHQFLYRLTDALRTCPKDRPSVPSDLAASCGKILREFKLIESANWTKIERERSGRQVSSVRDLYMEQAFLCGLIGARSFYHRQSVATVASWQDPEFGCFKFRVVSPGAAAGGNAPAVGRRILRDVAMIGDCSAHSSGLAMSYYSLALRFLLDA